MASSRKRSRAAEEEDHEGFELNPETRRGIIVVVVFAAAALFVLSFFGVTGALGRGMESVFSALFGWDRYLIPLLLILIGATYLFPDRGRFSTWNYLGIGFFFLSFNAVLNLLLASGNDPVTSDLSMAGGLIGQALAIPLPRIVGFWGAIVVTGAMLVVAILLIFNTSLRSLFGVHEHAARWMGVKAHLGSRKGEEEDDKEEDDEEEEEEEPEDEEEEDEEEEEEEEEIDMPRKRVRKEQEEEETALLTTRRRKVAIPLDLLDYRSTTSKAGDVENNKDIIMSTFAEFGIEVELGKTSTGPSVTQYTMRPARGVKLSRIVGLQNDLALALAAHPIRIEAPIPGKSLIGIEVPNQTASTVSLRELLEAKDFRKRGSDMMLPLGKDVSGKVWMAPLDKMPHVLVAGATGSGKSVCINTMIISLLYENGPDDLRFIMVDPKRVELTAYAGIPHLLVPPITKAEDAINALKWTVREMERRLDTLSKFGARDINSYNKKAEKKMPKIVFVIDELSDLMSVAGREMEAGIVRIAQMARAAGIHLVLATQRPSVDVITGLIKANVPARIAFSVASITDSRTILDVAGADKLLGRGDMLYTSAEVSKPKRLQGAYVSEEEVGRVVGFLKREGEPDYNYGVTEQEKSASVFGGGSDDRDPLIEDACAAILEAGKASTSFLQRRLKVGYARAARIIDELEEMGIIGPGNGAKPREVLVDEMPGGEEDYEEVEEREEEPAEEEWEDAEEADENEEEEAPEEEEEEEEEEEGEWEEDNEETEDDEEEEEEEEE